MIRTQVQEWRENMLRMRKRTVAASVAAALAAAVPALAMAADGPGKCGKGKRWDAESQTCVPKPKAPGSGAAVE